MNLALLRLSGQGEGRTKSHYYVAVHSLLPWNFAEKFLKAGEKHPKLSGNAVNEVLAGKAACSLGFL